MGRGRFAVKRLSDGRAMLNLGSSSQVAPNWNNIDSSWLVRLGKAKSVSRQLRRWGLLSEERYNRILKIDESTICWDLRKGIPFEDGTFDVVYHSHLLEHIDREDAMSFLQECRRVLAENGVIRIVVPDLELLARRYIGAMDHSDSPGSREVREKSVCGIIDQMVIRTPVARASRPLLVRIAEEILIGDTARSGELHRWMYDRVSLRDLLTRCGFRRFEVVSASTSRISSWPDFRLDIASDGLPTKEDSIYVEACK